MKNKAKQDGKARRDAISAEVVREILSGKTPEYNEVMSYVLFYFFKN